MTLYVQHVECTPRNLVSLCTSFELYYVFILYNLLTSSTSATYVTGKCTSEKYYPRKLTTYMQNPLLYTTLYVRCIPITTTSVYTTRNIYYTLFIRYVTCIPGDTRSVYLSYDYTKHAYIKNTKNQVNMSLHYIPRSLILRMERTLCMAVIKKKNLALMAFLFSSVVSIPPLHGCYERCLR